MATECFKCGVSSDKVPLYHAISNKGIVKVCGDCNSIEKLPIMRKPTDNQISESKMPRQASVQERLGNMNRNRLASREVNLRSIVDKDYNSKKMVPPSDLVPNFHWTIQRIRRARRISREEFAKAINETDATIRMIEQGFVPDSNYKVISKIENYLQVSLRKQGSSGFPDTNPQKKFILDNSNVEKNEREHPKTLGFDNHSQKDLKIADLKEMKKKTEEKPKGATGEEWEEEYSQDDEQFLDNPEEVDYGED
jgi:ribosome-binding protein aMBF1 (putative translation factor)